jgi:hypothetical protein
LHRMRTVYSKLVLGFTLGFQQINCMFAANKTTSLGAFLTKIS